MALKKNTNPAPVQLHPELQEILLRNGLQASIAMEADRPVLLVHGHDSPVISYDLTHDQIKKLTDWGGNHTNKTAYNTLTSIISEDFYMPKDFVHARNANGRVAMGLHGYRIGVGEYGRTAPMTTREAIAAGIPMAPGPYGGTDRPVGLAGRLLGWLGWTPRQQTGFHLRRVDGALYRGGGPIVPERPDGRMKPGELQSGGYGFYYKGEKQQKPEQAVETDPLKDLKAILMKDKADDRPIEAKPYNGLITSPVYFSYDKLDECLKSHGITIDTEQNTLTVEPKGLNFGMQYDLSEEEIKSLTSNSLKEHPMQERLDIINRLTEADFENPLTMDMLNSKEIVDLQMKEVTLEKVANENPGLLEENTFERSNDNGVAFENFSMNEGETHIEKEGLAIPIITEKEGWHWEQDIRGGRDVILRDVTAYETENGHYLRAVVNGEERTVELTPEEFREIHYRNDEVRLDIMEQKLDGIALKRGDYNGEHVTSAITHGAMLGMINEDKGWYRDGKDGREVEVGRIGVEKTPDGKYIMAGEIDGERVAKEISKKEYDKYLILDDYHRMKMFGKKFDEVDVKSNTSVGIKITAAIAAGMTVLTDLTQPPSVAVPPPCYGKGLSYYKPGVDFASDVAMRNFEAAINTEEIHNSQRR